MSSRVLIALALVTAGVSPGVSPGAAPGALQAASTAAPQVAPQPELVSTFGSYSGYSEESFDGWARHSEYAPLSDGTRIALDYFLPTAQGVAASGPLPTILMYTRYIRAWEDGSNVGSWLARSEALQRLLRHGYAVVIADARGTGTSFGVHNLSRVELPVAKVRVRN